MLDREIEYQLSLVCLENLKKSGLLNEEEFELGKAELMSKFNPPLSSNLLAISGVQSDY